MGDGYWLRAMGDLISLTDFETGFSRLLIINQGLLEGSFREKGQEM